ncbi:hypothetical protein D3C80_2088490 [compost metagenome]
MGKRRLVDGANGPGVDAPARSVNGGDDVKACGVGGKDDVIGEIDHLGVGGGRQRVIDEG